VGNRAATRYPHRGSSPKRTNNQSKNRPRVTAVFRSPPRRQEIDAQLPPVNPPFPRPPQIAPGLKPPAPRRWKPPVPCGGSGPPRPPTPFVTPPPDSPRLFPPPSASASCPAWPDGPNVFFAGRPSGCTAPWGFVFFGRKGKVGPKPTPPAPNPLSPPPPPSSFFFPGPPLQQPTEKSPRPAQKRAKKRSKPWPKTAGQARGGRQNHHGRANTK